MTSTYCNGSEIFLSILYGLIHLRLVTATMEKLRYGIYGVLSFCHFRWSVLLLLLGSIIGASAASVAAAATGCSASEKCNSEQLFDDCHRRGTTDSVLCYCSNGVPRACHDVCDGSVTPDACPSQCRGYFLCKTSNDPVAAMGSQFGWPHVVGIFIAVAAAVVAMVTGIIMVYRRRKDLNLPCYAPSRPTGEPEGDNSHPVLSGSVQEEAVHNSQETCPPGDQSSGPVIPSHSSVEPEGDALLPNA